MRSLEHINQAAHNLGLSLSIDETVYSDWVVTAVFYTAVHYVDAYLTQSLRSPRDHDDRRRLMANDRSLDAIFMVFQRLKDDSRNARYSGWRFSVSEIAAIRADLDFIRRHLGSFLPAVFR